MAVSDFDKYFNESLEHSEKLFEERKIPEVESYSPWLILGFWLGIAAIITTVISKYSFVIGAIGAIFSGIGYMKQKRVSGIVGIIIGVVAIILCFVYPFPRMMDGSETVLNNFMNLF